MTAAIVLPELSSYSAATAAFIAVALWCLLSALRRRVVPEVHYEARDRLVLGDLVDPDIRRDHLSFNSYLHRRFKGQRFVQVEGEERCFIAFSHGTCKDVMNDHASFSSNPFPDDRLVALNTMTKADHSRLLRCVHSHYAQDQVDTLEDKIREVIERCTDDMEQASPFSDVVLWAKRIHMVTTLSRLGVDWSPVASSWAKVDEVIQLNDSMVALVAPLGGVGPSFSTLPTFWPIWLLLGLIRSLVPTLRMAWRLGLRVTWCIVRPDVTVFCPPRKPRMGLWWHPELLPLVPLYFLKLYDLLQAPGGPTTGPLPGLKAGVAEGKISLEEALTLLVQLMVNMTSANALASLVHRFGREGEAVRKLKADPKLLGPFVLEVLRLDAPLQRNPRRATKLAPKWKDALLEGDQVLLFLGAAAMDPDVFEHPEEFRLDRPGGTILTFGSGMHYCLGSNLVKLEMRIALECLLKRYERIEVQRMERLTDIDVGNWGFRHLHVQLHRYASK